jgi:hypothetical protein
MPIPIINDFTKGELSPRFSGRSDLQFYYQGADTIENGIVLPQGGVERRPGTRYFGSVQDAGTRSRIIPFIENENTRYIIEMYDGGIRFIDPSTSVKRFTQWRIMTLNVAATPADFAVGAVVTGTAGGSLVIAEKITTTSYRVSDIKGSFIDGDTLTDGTNTAIQAAGAPSFAAESQAIAVATGGASFFEDVDLAGVRWVQVGNVMFFVTPTKKPHQLTRHASGAWEWKEMDFSIRTWTALFITPPETRTITKTYVEVSGVYNWKAGLITSPSIKGHRFYWYDSGGSLKATLTVVDTILYANKYLVETEDSPTIAGGDYILDIDGVLGWTSIDDFYSTETEEIAYEGVLNPDEPEVYKPGTVVKYSGVYYRAIAESYGEPGTDPTVTTYWYVLTTVTENPFASLFPDSIAFFQNRLIFGRGQTLWFSATGIYNVLVPGPNDSDSFNFNLLSERSDRILWFAAKDALSVGTTGGEWIISGGPNGITPTAVQAKRVSTYGSASIAGKLLNENVIFVQKSRRKLREQFFLNDVQANRAADLTVFSEHISTSGIRDFVYQSDPDPIIWAIKEDGTLIGMTYERELGTAGWHRHDLSGIVEDIAVVPGALEDEVWLIVRREINSSIVRYMEYFNPRSFTNQEDGYYVDAGITSEWDGTTKLTTVSGLNHLEGETVAVSVDGANHPDRTVTGGAITLEHEAEKAHVGLPFTTTIKTLPIELGSRADTTQPRRKRMGPIHVRFYKTLGALVGVDESRMELVQFRDATHPMGSAPPLFTGDKEVRIESEWGKDTAIIVQQVQPLPMTVLSIMPNINISDV